MSRIEPRAEKESVWDYPRPPRVELTSKRIKIIFNGIVIAETQRAYRILETSHPPVYSIPPQDVQMQYFTSTSHKSFCEFKGKASYWTIQLGDKCINNVAWSYANPAHGYEKSRVTFRYTLAKWMLVTWMTNKLSPRKVISMAAGLHQIL